jgi:hypothetical protein
MARAGVPSQLWLQQGDTPFTSYQPNWKALRHEAPVPKISGRRDS